MKKRWIGLGLAALLGVGGYHAFQVNKYRLPGMIADWRDPVQPNRPVVWQQGPGVPPEGNTAAEHHPDRRGRSRLE